MDSFCKNILASSLFISTISVQPTVVTPMIKNITNQLRKEDQVHFGYPVGFAGKPETNNRYYKLYLKLKEIRPTTN